MKGFNSSFDISERQTTTISPIRNSGAADSLEMTARETAKPANQGRKRGCRIAHRLKVSVKMRAASLMARRVWSNNRGLVPNNMAAAKPAGVPPRRLAVKNIKMLEAENSRVFISLAAYRREFAGRAPAVRFSSQLSDQFQSVETCAAE